MKSNNSLKINYTFIFFVLFSITLYNHLSSIFRFADFIILILIIYSIINYKEYLIKYFKYYFIIFLITIISQVYNINNTYYLSSIFNGLRYWFLAFVFFSFGNILSDMLLKNKVGNYDNYIKLIKIFYFLISITILIFVASFFKIDFIRNNFTPYIESSDHFVITGERIVGSSISIMYIIFFLIFILNLNKKHLLFFSLIFIGLFLFHLSRQTLITGVILLAILMYGRSKTKFGFGVLVIGLIIFSTFDIDYIKNNKLIFYRLSEIFYFFSSGAFFVRFTDSVFFFEDWINSDLLNFLLGKGIGSITKVLRYGGTFDEFTGIFSLDKSYIYGFFHSADFLPVLLIVDGGLILLIYYFFIIFNIFKKTYNINKIYFLIIILFFIANSIPSIHMITNYGNVFFISLVYHSTIIRKSNDTYLYKSTIS